MKQCTKCGGKKPEAEFYKDKSSGDGVTPACKICTYAAQGGKERAFARAATIRQRDPLYFMLANAKARAKKQGVPFSVRAGDIETPTHCPVFGVLLQYDGTGRGYGAKDDAASLDRIYTDRGYVPGNVIVVSWKANRVKCRLTPTELLRMASFYAKWI